MSREILLLLGLEALFRYRIVSAVKALELRGFGRGAAVCDVAGDEHHDEQGANRRMSQRTVYRWLAAYKTSGLEGLAPASRAKVAGSAVLDEKLLIFLAQERGRDRDASVPELLRRAEQYDIVADASTVDRTTAWRAMVRMGLETRRRKQPSDADTRRWRYPERMQMVLLDFKHFRAGVGRTKRAAVYMLDDATRYGLGVRVTTSERAEVVLCFLDETIRRYGLMDLIYWDGGSGFKDGDVVGVTTRLGVHSIKGRPRYPEGHGAIEVFNRGVKQRELRTYDGAPHIDPDCGALTLRLRHDLERYNHLPHEALEGDSPHQRWSGSERALRPAPSEQWLTECFTVNFERRVSNDHVVKVDSTLYEVPRGHAGEWIVIYRRLLERTPETDALYVEHQGRLVHICPVDLEFNATSGRSRRETANDEITQVPAKSSSTLSFERTFQPMTDPDGGYPDNEEED
ncbi:MAG: transposase [Deltaproteobacteria bacterium]|nr:transposase [Deltaproteobacteria bacterium]